MKTIYVVIKCAGQYDDYTETNIKAFISKDKAYDFAADVNKEQKIFAEKFKKLREKYEYLDSMDFWLLDEPTDEQEQAYYDEVEKFSLEIEALTSKRKMDKERDEIAKYEVRELELVK